MVMAVSEMKKVIDLDMAERAISLLEWQKEVRESYQPVDYTDIMSRIENLIRRQVKAYPGITHGTSLSKIGSKRFDSWKVQNALANLIKKKEIRPIPTRGTVKYLPLF